MPKRLPRLKVIRADAEFYFAFKRSMKESEVHKIFEQYTEPLQSEIFPGLILRDEEGNMLKPRLQVVLVPIEEEICQKCSFLKSS